MHRYIRHKTHFFIYSKHHPYGHRKKAWFLISKTTLGHRTAHVWKSGYFCEQWKFSIQRNLWLKLWIERTFWCMVRMTMGCVSVLLNSIHCVSRPQHSISFWWAWTVCATSDRRLAGNSYLPSKQRWFHVYVHRKTSFHHVLCRCQIHRTQI